MTSASTVLTVSGTAGIAFANFPALTVISDVLYLVCGQSATGATDGKIYLYYSADGTNWTLDRTVTHAAPSKKDYYGFDIFLIGATVWAVAQTTTDGNTATNNYVYFYDYGGAAAWVGDGVYGGCSCGSVIDSVYYYFSKGEGLTVDRWEFDGTQNAAKETDTYLTTAGGRTFNMRQTRYYVSGKAEIFAGYLFAWFYDYQKAEWAELTSANSIAGLCYSAWNVATHLVWGSAVYEILTGGFPIKVADVAEFLGGQCGWYPYIRGCHITNVTSHALLVGTTNISIESGTSTFSRSRTAMSITERSYNWGPDEFYKIYDPNGTLVFQGYCKSYRNKSLVTFESPITGDMMNTISLSPSADAGDDIITDILDRCNWLYAHTLSAGAGSFTYTLRSNIENQIHTAEALEGFICYWTIAHAVYYNNGTVDSTKSYSYGDGKLLKVNVGSEAYAIKRVILIGSDGTTIRQKSAAWGGQTYTDFTPHLSSSQRETFADGILAKNSQNVVYLECWIKGDGLLQWGQTITLSWSPESIAEATWYILESEWDFASQICHIKCTDALIYNLNGDQLKNKIESVATPLITAAMNSPTVDQITFNDGGSITQVIDTISGTSSTKVASEALVATLEANAMKSVVVDLTRSSAWTHTSKGSYVAIPFNSEVSDSQNTHDNTTNPSRITIPTGYGGWYAVHVSIYWAASPGVCILQPAVNGTEKDEYHGFTTPYGQTTWILYIAGGQYLEIFAYQGSAGNLATHAIIRPTLRVVRLASGGF